MKKLLIPVKFVTTAMPMINVQRKAAVVKYIHTVLKQPILPCQKTWMSLIVGIITLVLEIIAILTSQTKLSPMNYSLRKLKLILKRWNSKV